MIQENLPSISLVNNNIYFISLYYDGIYGLLYGGGVENSIRNWWLENEQNRIELNIFIKWYKLIVCYGKVIHEGNRKVCITFCVFFTL